jgi:hypothetical protein
MPARSFRLFLISIAAAMASFAQTPAEAMTDAPMTGADRVHWLVHQNLGPTALAENVLIGAEATLSNSPKEYGAHWDGFAKRVGITAANYGVKSTMEAGLGGMWGEDPRYIRTEGVRVSGRFGHIIKMTFFARNRAGNEVPAYARFLAIPGSNFLANTWMPDSQASLGDAVARTALGFLSRMGGNAFKEFRPRH